MALSEVQAAQPAMGGEGQPGTVVAKTHQDHTQAFTTQERSFFVTTTLTLTPNPLHPTPGVQGFILTVIETFVATTNHFAPSHFIAHSCHL